MFCGFPGRENVYPFTFDMVAYAKTRMFACGSSRKCLLCGMRLLARIVCLMLSSKRRKYLAS